MASESFAYNNADQEAWRPSVNPWLIAVSVIMPTFMEVLDTTIANVALDILEEALTLAEKEYAHAGALEAAAV